MTETRAIVGRRMSVRCSCGAVFSYIRGPKPRTICDSCTKLKNDEYTTRLNAERREIMSSLPQGWSRDLRRQYLAADAAMSKALRLLARLPKEQREILVEATRKGRLY